MFVEILTEIEDSTKSMTKMLLKNLCKSAKSASNKLEFTFRYSPQDF